jgi:hypothetical protein
MKKPPLPSARFNIIGLSLLAAVASFMYFWRRE